MPLAQLDWLTPPIHEACADDRCRQFQQRFVDIQSSFKADSQLAKTCKPAVRPLHLPAMLAQSLAALDASSGNATNDASLPQVGSASLEVVAFVGVRVDGLLRGCPSKPVIAAIASTHFSDILESCLFAPLTKITRGMPLASTTMCRLEPSLPQSVGLGPVSWPPRGLGAEEPSMLARLQSIWSCSRKRDSMAWCNCSQTPAAFKSRRCSQHVMPLPYQRDWGRSSQGMPVCRRNKMPLRAASLLTASLRAPPLAEGTKAGIRGCSCCHSSLLTGRRAKRITSITALRGPLI